MFIRILKTQLITIAKKSVIIDIILSRYLSESVMQQLTVKDALFPNLEMCWWKIVCAPAPDRFRTSETGFSKE